ncbi:hypothetical protein [Oceanirhabdus sp. W0125-5]|uniref:hypothetical protein n=1 Tax=Oceanirhabdus sp. W0125-5 TaxID=2999116 RepID=UPI0022F34545|nr:hypothetical protein [Oceanirhabdus sp. W0125-5]WBW94771.1 hypothetical protein OW730_13805 [Oceanirhabdus sp. W0125-5]
MENITNLINQGYKIMKFERDIDLTSGQEVGVVELKALDGYLMKLNFDDNCADEMEKVIFNYLKEK